VGGRLERRGADALSAAPSVLVLGGGLSGMAAAWSLARAGIRDITIIERGRELGGLAGTFEQDGHFYPLGYHHILHHDRTLLYVLDRIGALPSVRWRRIRMFFRLGGRLYDLADPVDFARFPMRMLDKLRFVRLMLRSFRKENWSDWIGRGADELVDRWGGPGVREAIFERLTRLKFGLPCHDISGAWLGTRLYFREGSSPLGYIPGANWTKVLCDGLTRLLEAQGVRILTGTSVTALRHDGARVERVELEGGASLAPDRVVCTLPTEIYRAMVPADTSPHIDSIRYTAMISVIAATMQPVEPDFYWMNLASLDLHGCGIFKLNALNPTIGGPGESCINFVTHLRSREEPFFRLGDAELLAAYGEDFRAVFGFTLEPRWTHITRLPMYSPVFTRGYDNPPPRSATLANLWFAGNYRTFPSVASTGTAMASGLETAEALLADLDMRSPARAEAASFRLAGMPRG
jgi:protoporphyrinogen oxidase